MQSGITFDSDTGSGSNPLYTTTLTLDALGRAKSAVVADGLPKSVSYVLDGAGQIVRHDESRNSNPSAAAPHEVFYRFAGHQIGMIGNDGAGGNAGMVGYAQSVAERSRTAVAVTASNAGLFRDGTSTGSAAAFDFAQSSEAINAYQQGSGSGAYTVQGGETLGGIAQAVWGDASLWYKLAEANGLTLNSPLLAGQQLRLPAGVNRSHYNASTFKPYDPTDASGNLSPTSPKPPKKPKCGVLGQILLTVIAVAVTYFTAGAATAALGPVLGGAAAGAAGSIASQAVGLATGIQSKFSFKGVALAAVGGAVGGGLKAADAFAKLGIAGNLIGALAAQGALTGTITQGIGVATGLQSKFDFVGVAASAAGSVAGGKFGGLFKSGFFASSVGNDIASASASLLANAATRSALSGTNFGNNLIAALPDAIGGVLGRALGGTRLDRTGSLAKRGIGCCGQRVGNIFRFDHRGNRNASLDRLHTPNGRRSFQQQRSYGGRDRGRPDYRDRRSLSAGVAEGDERGHLLQPISSPRAGWPRQPDGFCGKSAHGTD